MVQRTVGCKVGGNRFAERIRLMGMDRVRFGRALGTGAREAGKALWKAADAAVAPNPAGKAVGVKVAQARAAGAGVKRGGKKFGEAVWGPFVKASGVVWLEVTGVFFGLFCFTAGVEVWKKRADFWGAGEARTHVWFAVGMLVVFGWFTGSSFLRARRRGRR